MGEIAAAIGGSIENGPGSHLFLDYHFDSRLLNERSLFFALKSDHGDGHRYLPQVAALAGAGAVVASDCDTAGVACPLIRVRDPQLAFRQLAAHVRDRFSGIRYIGVTGSAGKTTTKEFIYQILSRKYRAFRSPANWNNWQGLPFALLKMAPSTEAAVFELAMSSPGRGEIARLVEILRPDITVILNALPVHLEYLKTLENVSRAKMEINDCLAADGVAFINGDYPLLRRLGRKVKGRPVFFGREKQGNEIVLKGVSWDGTQSRLAVDFDGVEREFITAIRNEVQIDNLFAAILVANQAGMTHEEIQSALLDLAPVAGRGVVRQQGGWTVVDDTYNANPEAMKRMLDWVDRAYPPPKVAVLGDMLELGAAELEFHREVGAYLARLHFDALVTVGHRAGALADGAAAAGFPADRITRLADAAAAGVHVCKTAPPGSTILFKASRGMRMEQAVQALAGGSEGASKPAGSAKSEH